MSKPETTEGHPCPIGESRLVWSGACALAVKRHPEASWPQPQDIDDARVVLTQSLAACEARADVYRHLERHFGRLTTMQCPATLEIKMRKMAEKWEAATR